MIFQVLLSVFLQGITFSNFTAHMSIGIIFVAVVSYGFLRLYYRKMRQIENPDPPEIAGERERWERERTTNVELSHTFIYTHMYKQLLFCVIVLVCTSLNIINVRFPLFGLCHCHAATFNVTSSSISVFFSLTYSFFYSRDSCFMFGQNCSMRQRCGEGPPQEWSSLPVRKH